MRRTAGWRALEIKPDGQHLFRDKELFGEETPSQLDGLRQSCALRIADQDAELVDATLACPVLGPVLCDRDTRNLVSVTRVAENQGAVAAEGPVDSTSPASREFVAPPYGSCAAQVIAAR